VKATPNLLHLSDDEVAPGKRSPMTAPKTKQRRTNHALLHTISEEFVEAVEALLDHEKSKHKPSVPSWIPPEGS
jgi:hypothetical protein